MCRILALCLALAPAMSAASLSGTVVDAQSGEALARVRVQLSPGAAPATTDPAGRFRFDELKFGWYTLTVETVGYRQLIRMLWAGSEDVDLLLVLSPDTFRRTDSVEVRADPFDPGEAPGPSEQTILASEVKNLGTVLMDDPVRALHSMPGVSVNDDFHAQFAVRGAPYNRIGLYLDDILLHAPFHTMQNVNDAGSLSILSTDMLDSISLLPSVLPSRYGDRTGAAVDVRTRDGSRTERNFRASINLASITGMTEGPIGRRGSWIVSARKSYLQHLVTRFTDDPTLAIGFLDYQGKLTYDLTSRQTATVHVVNGTTDVDKTRARDRLGVNSIIFARYQPTIARANWRWTPGEDLVLNATGAWMRERFDNYNRNDLRLAYGQYGEWVAGTSALWRQSSRHNLEAGWQSRRIRDSGYSVLYFNNTSVERLRDQYRGTVLRHGGFAQQTLSLGILRLNAGLRFDRLDALDHHATSPHLSAAVRVRRGTEVRLGWGQNVQYPEPWMLYTGSGGLRLLPERASHLMATAEQRIGSQIRLRVEAFERADRDLIARPLLDPRIHPQTGVVVIPRDIQLYNSVRSYARGAQVVVQRRSANRVSGWAGYLLLFSRNRDGVEDLHYRGYMDQRHTFNSWISYRILPSLNVSAAYNYGSGFPIPGFIRREDEDTYFLSTARNTSTLGSYQRLDLRVNKSFSRERWKWTLYGELLNATNHRNLRMNSFDGVDTRTGQARLSVIRVFPILPSCGLMIEF